MTEPVDISAGYEKQIRAAVAHYFRTYRNGSELEQAGQHKTPSAFPDHAVILNAELPGATHALTGATSCLATICQWDTSANTYKETDQQIRVWNHAESTDHAADTFGVARNINGHYWFFGDCEPMASREVPE